MDTCNSYIDDDVRKGDDIPSCQQANQIFYSQGGVHGGPLGDTSCAEKVTGQWSYFHPTHKHWHSSSVYEFTLHNAVPCDGGLCPEPTPLDRTNKITFCLIDWVSATKNNGNNGNNNTNNGNLMTNSQRVYFDCESADSIQGISTGWMDQYHHALDGMDFDITPYLSGLLEEDSADFFVVATANSECHYWETDYDNNIAFVGIRVTKKGNGGNFAVNEIENSKSNTCCWDPQGKNPSLRQDHMCGEGLSNH